MKPIEKKTKFVELRSQGMSFDTISKELAISTGTCSEWNKELRNEVETLKGERMKELYTIYGMDREARIRRTGNTLKKIEEALSHIDLSQLPPDKLLDFALRYQEALSKEYVAPKRELDQKEGTREALIQALADIVDRVRSGELSPEQAKTETQAVTNLLKAVEMFGSIDKENKGLTVEFVSGEYTKAYTDEKTGETYYTKRLVPDTRMGDL